MAKSPFEKIRSLVERKKLFEALLKEQTEVICKGQDDSLFSLKPTSLVADTHMRGFITALEKAPTHDTEVIGNFSVGVERFFFQAMLAIKGDEGSIQLNSDVYRLQRRASARLNVQPTYGMYLAIIEFQGKPVYSIAQMADLSAGGARIFFSNVDSPVPATVTSKNLGLKVGDRFKAVLHLSNLKNVEVKGEIKHSRPAVHRGEIVDHFGVEFVELTNSLKNRLISLTMDLQRRMIHED